VEKASRWGTSAWKKRGVGTMDEIYGPTGWSTNCCTLLRSGRGRKEVPDHTFITLSE